MKNSEYWRHMHFNHGIDQKTRKRFVGPSETRWAEVQKKKSKGGKKDAPGQTATLTETWTDDGWAGNNVGLGLSVPFEGQNHATATEDGLAKSTSWDQSEAENLTVPSPYMKIILHTPVPGPGTSARTSNSIVIDQEGRKWSKQGFCELCNDWVTMASWNEDEGGWWRHVLNVSSLLHLPT